MSESAARPIVVLISANSEWQPTVTTFTPQLQASPYGDFFQVHLAGRPVLFLRGGWGKIAAAASTEYAIQRWQPAAVFNLGTCGGFSGLVQRGEILLVNETVVYDIIEQMGDAQQAIDDYTTRIDLSWLQPPYPQAVRVGRLVSADRDLLAEQIPDLKTRFGAVAGDWESGAIAWVCARRGLPCLILRGVSDLVDAKSGGEAYGNFDHFAEGARQVMHSLLANLPGWVERIVDQ